MWGGSYLCFLHESRVLRSSVDAMDPPGSCQSGRVHGFSGDATVPAQVAQRFCLTSNKGYVSCPVSRECSSAPAASKVLEWHRLHPHSDPTGWLETRTMLTRCSGDCGSPSATTAGRRRKARRFDGPHAPTSRVDGSVRV